MSSKASKKPTEKLPVPNQTPERKPTERLLVIPNQTPYRESDYMRPGSVATDSQNGEEDSSVAESDDRKHTDVVKSMEEIHQTFTQVVEEFRGDKAAGKLLVEYEKLYEYLKNSNQELRGWKYRCAGLVDEVKINTDKLNLAIHLSQEDRALIASLNKQSNDAWSMVDDLHEREKKARETVTMMQDEIHVLTGMVENGLGLSELQKLSNKAHTDVKRENEANKNLKEEVNTWTTRYNDMSMNYKKKVDLLEEIIEKLKQKNDQFLLKLEEEKEVKEEIQQKVFILERAKNKAVGEKQRLEIEIHGNKQIIEQQLSNISDLQQEIFIVNKNNVSEKARYVQKCKELAELTKKDEKLTMRLKVTEEKLHAEIARTKSLKIEIQSHTKDLHKKDGEMALCKKKMAAQSKQLIKASESLANCGQQLKLGGTEFRVLEVNFNHALKDLEKVSKNLNRVIRNYESSEKALKKTKQQKQQITGELAMKNEENIVLDGHLIAAHRNIRSVIDKLTGCISQKENLIINMNVQANQISMLENDLITKDCINNILEKSNTTLTINLTEAMRSRTHAMNERDSIQALLNTSELENNNFRLANANLVKQGKSCQTEILNKEAHINQVNEKLSLLRAQYDQLCRDLIHCDMEKAYLKNQLFQAESQLKNANNHIDNQNYIIDDKNIRIAQLTSHRNILGATCVKNNSKIDTLQTKHELMTAIVNNGNKLYDERLKEIKLLHLQNTDIWRQKDNIMHKLQSIDNLKSKLSLANSELVSCKARLRALEDQPLKHVHTWRTIKAKDYSKFELVMKSTYLVKKLIIKSDEVARLEVALIDKAHILNHLKVMLSRTPGPEVMVNAANDRKAKEKAEKKLKAALAERNMMEWKAEEMVEQSKYMKKAIEEEKKKRIEVIKGCQKTMQKCEKKLEENNKTKERKEGFLPPIFIKNSSSI